MSHQPRRTESPLRLALAAAVAVTLSAAPARAEKHSPLFQMPSVFAGRTVGAELMMGTINFFPSSMTLAAVEFQGEFSPTRRLSLRGLLPIAYGSGDNVSGTTLGNLTLGLQYVVSARRAASNYSVWGMGTSLSLPTASDGGESGIVAAAHGVFRMPSDPGRYAPNTTTLRLHGDYRLESGQLFFQGQAGVHFLVIDNADDQLLLALGLGGGAMATRNLALLVELTTLSDFLDDGDGEDFWHVLEFGVRIHVDGGAFGARFYLPLDESLRDGLDILGFAVDYRATY